MKKPFSELFEVTQHHDGKWFTTKMKIIFNGISVMPNVVLKESKGVSDNGIDLMKCINKECDVQLIGDSYKIISILN
ncbi:MAG: hypothetical protein P4L41_12340 [Flavipsychrobacter sp.]|nr:hypothetical protein [Flavipsychrobacter sp.]